MNDEWWLEWRCFYWVFRKLHAAQQKKNSTVDEKKKEMIFWCILCVCLRAAGTSLIQHRTLSSQMCNFIRDLLCNFILYRKIISNLIISHQSSKLRFAAFMSGNREGTFIRIHYTGFVLFYFFRQRSRQRRRRWRRWWWRRRGWAQQILDVISCVSIYCMETSESRFSFSCTIRTVRIHRHQFGRQLSSSFYWLLFYLFSFCFKNHLKYLMNPIYLDNGTMKAVVRSLFLFL